MERFIKPLAIGILSLGLLLVVSQNHCEEVSCSTASNRGSENMVTFRCHKLGRDKVLENFKAGGVSLRYEILSGQDLCEALKLKLIEEASEVHEASNLQDITVEIADVLEVIDGLCKAYGISLQDVMRAKEKKYKERGGFETGLFIETLEMDEINPIINYFRASPDKYPEK